MARSEAVRAAGSEAEHVRRRLAETGMLRRDLEVARDGRDVLFPVAGCPAGFRTEVADFAPRPVPPRAYQELLPPGLADLAPRSFDVLGDLCITKVPPPVWEHRDAIGAALRRFTRARAVFHDAGVKGPYRVRALERIAGDGDTETQVTENGVRLRVDPGRAYYSPRLAHERAVVAAQVHDGEHVLDLFGGVAPFGVQAGRRGAVVDSVDLNPDACVLARRNAEENRVADRITVHEGDAREVAARLEPAARVVMNLPHGAAAFLDLAERLVEPGGMLHFHAIMPRDEVAGRAALWRRIGGRDARVVAWRTVRTYSAQEDHVAFDVRIA